jgi:hypothetical protein
MLKQLMLNGGLVICGLAGLAASSAQAQSPIGSEFLVNSQSTNAFDPDIAAGPDGAFTVVWPHADDPSTGPEALTARQFSILGPTSGEINLVAAWIPNSVVDYPKIIIDPKGGWTLFYSQYRFNGYRQVLASRFSRNGSPSGTPFVVSKPLPSFADLHAASRLPSGGYFILTDDDLCPGCRVPRHHLFARVLGLKGGYASPYFLVDTNTARASFSGAKSLGVDATGQAVVVWETQPDVIVPNHTVVLGQRFSSTGARLGDLFFANKQASGFQRAPSVAVHPAGDFVVVWEDYPDVNAPHSVRGQRFSKGGKPVGDEFVVAADPSGDSVFPSIAGDSQGNFVVVWTNYDSPFCPVVKGRLYHPDGTPFGAAFPLASSTDSCDELPQVAFGPDGVFGAVWTRDLDDGGSDIFAALFRVGTGADR